MLHHGISLQSWLWPRSIQALSCAGCHTAGRQQTLPETPHLRFQTKADYRLKWSNCAHRPFCSYKHTTAESQKTKTSKISLHWFLTKYVFGLNSVRIFDVVVADLSFLEGEKLFTEICLEIRTEFPTISEMTLNAPTISYCVFFFILSSIIYSIKNSKIQVSINSENHQTFSWDLIM